MIYSKTVKWYYQHGRDFPWRHIKDPYKIMIAEFMLQRTRAEQVQPVFVRFIEKFPDIFSLANASHEDVKFIISSLGLYWRSRHFLDSARFVVEKYNGHFPHNINKLLEIPGVGDYVAGAIMVICYNKPAPVVDSNIARFIDRFYGFNLKGEIRRKKQIVQKAEVLFNCRKPGVLLFAIIDFTALICKIKPDCNECFLQQECMFKKNQGLQNESLQAEDLPATPSS